MRLLTVVVASVLVTGAICFAMPGYAPAKKVHWHQAGASVFGGKCEPWMWQGYRGDNLQKLPNSFAELRMGTALGGLAHKQAIRVLHPGTHRKLTIRKRDIGGGGGNVAGLVRAIDLWEPVLTRLLGHLSCNWTGRVLWRIP